MGKGIEVGRSVQSKGELRVGRANTQRNEGRREGGKVDLIPKLKLVIRDDFITIKIKRPK